MQLFTNNAVSTLASSIGTGTTSISVAAGEGALFPAPSGGNTFQLTLLTSTGGVETDVEIVTATARTGDVITITREQEGTTAVAHGAASVVSLRDTAKFFNDTASALATVESTANKNASGGYVGLSGFAAMLKNAAGTITSLIASAATVARTWTFPDKSGTVAMTSDITGTNSGTNTGDQTITLTGDVAGSGTGSFAATIQANAVTLAKMATVATATLLGRSSGGTGNVESLSTATVRTQLSINNIDNTSDANKPVSSAQQTALDLKQNLSGKNAVSGYAGLTATYQIQFRDVGGSFISVITNANTGIRTYTLRDRSGTIADDTDLALKADLSSPTFTGPVMGQTAAVDDNTTKFGTTGYYWGQKGAVTPLMNGIAAAGASGRWSPIDHIHPVDTSRAGLAANSFSGDQTLGDNKIIQAALVDCGLIYLDKGNSGTTAQVFDYTQGSSQQVTATGAHSFSITNWPPSGVEGYIKVRYVNGGLFAITPPTVYWQLPTGGHTTSFSSYMAAIGRTALQTSDVDELILWSSNNGGKVYGKLL